jgi:hypothetical protein
MPYVRVTVVSYDPARHEELERFDEEQIYSRMRELPGFRRWTAAGDSAGHRVTISEWDTLEQAQVGALPPLGLAQSFEDLPASLRQEALYVYEVTSQF